MVLRHNCESGRCGNRPGTASTLCLLIATASLALSGAYAGAPSVPTGYRLEPSAEVSSLAAGPSRAGPSKERGLDALAKARDLSVSEPDEYTRGRIVLDMVHAIISSYSELETRLDTALLDGRRVDVETTVPDGYDATVHRLVPGSAKEVDTGLRGVVALALRNRATLLERADRDRADRFPWDTLAGRVNNVVTVVEGALGLAPGERRLVDDLPAGREALP